jgi:hypothetical protein
VEYEEVRLRQFTLAQDPDLFVTNAIQLNLLCLDSIYYVINLPHQDVGGSLTKERLANHGRGQTMTFPLQGHATLIWGQPPQSIVDDITTAAGRIITNQYYLRGKFRSNLSKALINFINYEPTEINTKVGILNLLSFRAYLFLTGELYLPRPASGRKGHTRRAYPGRLQ